LPASHTRDAAFPRGRGEITLRVPTTRLLPLHRGRWPQAGGGTDETPPHDGEPPGSQRAPRWGSRSDGLQSTVCALLSWCPLSALPGLSPPAPLAALASSGK